MTDLANISITPPKTIIDFEQLARLAGQLSLYHGDDLNAEPVKLQTDHGIWFHAALARTPDGTAIGFAGWYTYYDMHKATRGIELQNLFVEARWRSHKVGYRLVQHVVVEAVRHDCAQLRIGVRKDNALAVAFYTRLGCEMIDRGALLHCRLDREKMRQLLSKA
jgi:ribosomal protein S18 acetylase RimI-like enzyme